MEDDVTTSWARWEKRFLEIMKQCIPQSILPIRERIYHGYQNLLSNLCESVTPSIKNLRDLLLIS
jgi:hypothetical protein